MFHKRNKHEITDSNIRDIINLQFDNRNECIEKYGHISKQKVGKVIDMSLLFENRSNFNENLNNWNVLNVTNMSNMFKNCSKFNSSLNKWNVTNMNSMFEECVSFDQPLNN